MATYIHYGDAKHPPMMTVSAPASVYEICTDVQRALREGTPVTVQVGDLVYGGREFLVMWNRPVPFQAMRRRHR